MGLQTNRTKIYRQVKAGFILQGTSLSEWCSKNGVARQNAHKALMGDWKGRKATLLINAILDAAGIERS